MAKSINGSDPIDGQPNIGVKKEHTEAWADVAAKEFFVFKTALETLIPCQQEKKNGITVSTPT